MKRIILIGGGIALLLAAALIGGYGLIRDRGPEFAGEVLCVAGHPERVAITPAADPAAQSSAEGLVYISVPGDLIRVSIPESVGRWINPRAMYDAVYLPFALRLDSVDKHATEESRNLIQVIGPDDTRFIPAVAGQALSLGGTEVTFQGPEQWGGILRYGGNPAMAEIALRPPNGVWVQDIVIQDGTWLRPWEGLALHLAWVSSEDVARQHTAQALPGVESWQWGIAEGNEVYWMNSFLPGASIESPSGITATLLSFDDKRANADGTTGPAIEVEVAAADERSRGWHTPGWDESSPVRFDCPSLSKAVLRIAAWEDGRAWMAAYRDGAVCGEYLIEKGESRVIPELDAEVRLDALLDSAVAVRSEDSLIYEAVLQGPQKQWRIREEEMIWIDEYQVAFLREDAVPNVVYAVSVLKPDGGLVRTLSLDAVNHYRQDGWIVKQGKPKPRALDTAIIAVERDVRTGEGFWAILLATLGILLLRCSRKRPRPIASPAEDSCASGDGPRDGSDSGKGGEDNGSPVDDGPDGACGNEPTG